MDEEILNEDKVEAVSQTEEGNQSGEVNLTDKTLPFDCKAYLKLKIPKWYNVMGLSWERYELVECDYYFHKGTNLNGEVNTGVKGGMFTASVVGTPSRELLAWMFDHTKKFNGEVTVMDTYNETIEQVYFEEARLTGLKLHYKAENIPDTVTVLTMIVDSLQIGDAYFEKFNL
ncbi:MAG: hypothetical protein LBE91_20705 [Tannerella sp.]|jgi:hypothetical protein|nr:hypothetical protein [Tannerella sp.]